MGFLLYIVAMLLNFYLLPIFVMDTGSGMFILLLVIPAIVLISSCVFGICRRFNLFVPIITAVLFVPAVFIFFNESATVYVAIYAVISFAGNLIGGLFSRK